MTDVSLTIRFVFIDPPLDQLGPLWRIDLTHPVKYRKHHVELLLLLLLGHVTRRVAQLGEEASQVHQAESVVLRAALLLPRPPHDPFHHVHLERLCQGKGSPVGGETYNEGLMSHSMLFNTDMDGFK